MALLELDGVSKVFGKNPSSVIQLLRSGKSKEDILKETGHVVGLRDVSVNIEAGEIFVIIGLSGSGKSTLIRHLNRLIEPTCGEIRLHGENILAADAKALQRIRQTRMAMVFQHFGLMPHRTVLQNVAYGLEVRREPRDTREGKARQWIARVGLKGYEAAYPAALSGGMQQRVGLARALATNPEILLMDEPFSALDPLIRRDMQRVLLGLQRDLKKTIVFITHDLDEALAIGDRIAILHDGVLVQTGRQAEIILSPATPYVRRFVGNVNRLRALKVADVMSAPRTATDGKITGFATLEEALPCLAKKPHGLAVTGLDGVVTGSISLEAVLASVRSDAA
jgi:glycine betaine/proline transport system ATP-binding protein